MNRLFTRESMKGIGQSLIASVFFVLILEPIIHIGKNMLSKGWIALVDYFYYSCGHISNGKFLNYFAYCIFLWLIMGFSFSPIMRLILLFRNQNKAENDLKTASTITAAKARIKSTIITVVEIAMCILFLLNMVIFQYTPAMWNSEFERRIIQISPYVTEKKINCLRSSWASMETKNDYILILEEVNYILKINNLP